MTTARAYRPPDDPAGRARRASAGALGLIALGMCTLAAGVVLVVGTKLGQRADERSRWSVVVPDDMQQTILSWLGMVSIRSAVLALAVVVLLALLRRRIDLAVTAVALVAGANVTTQLLKEFIPRPGYGVGPVGNSLPSGHTTVYASLALALLIVLPRALRPVLVLAASAVATFTGAATVLERWHRPSDVIAALGVCAIWAGALLWVLLRRRARVAHASRSSPANAGGLRPRFALHLGAGLLGAGLVGAQLIAGGLAAHENSANVFVGAVMLTTTGLAAALLAAVVGTLADETDPARPLPPQHL